MGDAILEIGIHASAVVGAITLIYLSVRLVTWSRQKFFPAQEVRQEGGSFRDELGSQVIVGSISALFLISITAIAAAIAKDLGSGEPSATLETARWVLSSVLPLLGAWVGTVLAFYFGERNFKAASEATKELVRLTAPSLATISIRDVMIKPADIVGAISAPDDQLGNVGLADIDTAFAKKLPNQQPVPRVLIKNSNESCIAIIHRSTLEELRRLATDPAKNITWASDPLSKVMDESTDARVATTFGAFITGSFAVAPITGSLADAKAKMESINGCQDVIVTESGNPSEALAGWITNVEISKALRA